ncbi:MAG: hypothetical protein WCD63_19970 [Terrimicrobiaceae bacterium]
MEPDTATSTPSAASRTKRKKEIQSAPFDAYFDIDSIVLTHLCPRSPIHAASNGWPGGSLGSVPNIYGGRIQPCPAPPATPGQRGLSRSSTAENVASDIERVRSFYDPLIERLYENADPRKRDLEQLEQISFAYCSRQAFLSELTLDPPHRSPVACRALEG